MNNIQRFSNEAVLWKIGYPTEEQRAVILENRLVWVRPLHGYFGYVSDVQELERKFK